MDTQHYSDDDLSRHVKVLARRVIAGGRESCINFLMANQADWYKSQIPEGSATDEWKQEALRHITNYARDHKYFLVENARAFAYTNGLVKSDDERVWGLVIRDAAAKGIVQDTGEFGAAVSSHKTGKHIWESLVFVGVAAPDALEAVKNFVPPETPGKRGGSKSFRKTAPFYCSYNGATVYVKVGDYFRSKGGLKDPWGNDWVPVEARTAGEARRKHALAVGCVLSSIYDGEV
jgi:hypothetical protein